MAVTESTLTASQRRQVHRAFKVYRNTGSVHKGKWVYQPHDFDSSFQLWSDAYPTRREAVEAAYGELLGTPPPIDDAANFV